MRIKVEREVRVRFVVIDLKEGVVRVESEPPETVFEKKIDDGFMEFVRRWLVEQDGIKEAEDGEA